MKTIDDYSFANVRALIRVDFNVPLNSAFEIADDTRIQATVPTIQKILNDGGSVVLMSHLGRPKGEVNRDFSLSHIVSHLSKVLGVDVKFASDCVGAEAEGMSASLAPGEVLLLENLRFHSEEEAGDAEFAKQLALHGQFYVNDAFGTAHRAHASTAVIAQYFADKKAFGYVMGNEVLNVDKVLHSEEKPVTAIVGGAKVSSKIDIITNLMNRVDHLIIGGGMAYTFLKAQGGSVGNSLVEDDKLDLAKELLSKAEAAGVTFHLPVDSLNADAFSADANVEITEADAIRDGWMGLDIGPKTIENYAKVVKESATILWNGPLGVFEFEAFSQGTKSLGLAIAEATDKGSFSLVGGGDSVAAVKQFNLANRVSYVSTGGGAMLEYLEGKVLPGIKAILD
ncbi:phosphoglycerate kinase [Phaeocystidibacter marisrubri]|uniref:Phosphoglycerate kinase n=1 Tax=Phaeocystidibacter marisrubri TaxID=1577780 RepID=A0A6L3ZGB5_9FLAO|nr:phosphoglycerate kinase [Phaeocystidibacter marisrubri]KAB2816508.1 phosphoglycerate kinase [Phaeocystidibacter marisrubri]GGH69410.1 phosphoglycerate kinase [Phaeocystidibacter marisrubri]